MRDVLFWVAFIPVLAFPFAYHLLARWYESREGWYHMAMSLALLSLGLPSVLRRMFGEGYFGEETIRTVAILFMAAVVWWRLILLIKSQAEKRRRVRRSTDG